MQIIIYNQKGGVGKSMLATQISLHFDATIFELDPYGVLSQTLEDDRVYKIALDEEVPEVSDGDVVYDFGGFDDVRLDKIAHNANLVIIPFNPTINSLGTTLKSYYRVFELNLPILFIVNSYMKEKDAEEAIEYIQETIANSDVTFFSIPNTRALQTSENEGKSIMDISASSPLKKHTYKKINTIMQNLMSKIQEYI
ncbi:hypothetical protein JHD48_05215 [Sulfurimonas sp. SAG-AH-194-I05]|nr:hypothetical protein [Sulfurimonas sp. SAG-AH-194-I05]MDF1875126.1 hypothetical protein [Sulfurimonas sp. SAG-AH-194-I05]